MHLFGADLQPPCCVRLQRTYGFLCMCKRCSVEADR